MEPDFGSWQSPNISRSHLYHVTIAWTYAIYWEYTVLWSRLLYKMDLFDLFWSSTEDCISLMSAGQGCCLSQNILLLNMMILIWKSCCMLCFVRLRKLLIVEIPGGWCRFLQSFRDQLDVVVQNKCHCIACALLIHLFCINIQYCAVITWSVFSQVLATDTP